MNRLFLYLMTLPVALSSSAQQYKFEAPLENPTYKEGFYTIPLPPQVEARLLSNYADLRLLDSTNAQVPFLQLTESPYFKEESFKEYPIVSKKIIQQCCTELVLKNTDQRALNTICLVLKNSNAIKLGRISGSDDGENWYGVGAYDLFYNKNSDTDTTVINYIHFPLSNYLYFKIELTDRGYWSAKEWIHWDKNRWDYPVNILRVGYYESNLKEGKYTPLPISGVIQTDSLQSKQTYVKISFEEAYSINRIRFTIQGPRFYKRLAILAKKITNLKTKKYYFQPIHELALSSISLNEFDFSDFRINELYLIIENDDNPVLKVKQVEAWQLTRYLKTYLQQNSPYRITFGDSTAQKPRYDLQYFSDSIPSILPSIAVSSIQNYIATKAQNNTADHWYENKAMIWLAIGTIFVLLAFMSWKMMKEMGTTKES